MEYIIIILIFGFLYFTGLGKELIDNIKRSVGYQKPLNSSGNENINPKNEKKPEDKQNYQKYSELTEELINYNKGITKKIPSHILSSDDVLDRMYRNAIYDITKLVKRDYPLSLWNFGVLNIGYYIRCSSDIPIKITTYDGLIAEEIVIMTSNHQVDNFKSSISKQKAEEAKRKEQLQQDKKINEVVEIENVEIKQEINIPNNIEVEPEVKNKPINIEAVANDWLAENLSYLEELYQLAISEGSITMLISLDTLPNNENVQLELVKKLGIDRGFSGAVLNEKGIEVCIELDIDIDIDMDETIELN